MDEKTPNGMEQFLKLSRDRLWSIITRRQFKWRAPKHWSAQFSGSQKRIYHTIHYTPLEKLKITYDAVKGEPKQFKLVHLSYSCKEASIE
jgi:hypothetical protein